MSYLNAILRPLFDALLWPFRGLPPIVGLLVISAVAAVGMLSVFKFASNQERLAEVKRQIHACFFEIRLFNDDLRSILRAQGEIMKHNANYLRLSLVPMLWMLPPLVLVIAQLQFHYGYRGLDPEETVLLKVELADSWDRGRPDLTVEVPDGLRVQDPPIWIPSLKEMDWRLIPEMHGDYEVALLLEGESYGKTVQVSDRVERRSPVRTEARFLDQLLYPAEPPLAKDGPIKSITVGYPEAEVSLFGFEMHWMLWFFVLSIVFGFALRNRMGVTI